LRGRGLLAELELILEILAEGIATAIRRRQLEIARHLELAYEWLREAARPPAGVRLVADDGSAYSGFAVFEKNEPVLMLAFRHGGGRAPIVTPPPAHHRSYYGTGLLDPDDPRWDRDVNPYERR
jgi:hypothetical protein